MYMAKSKFRKSKSNTLAKRVSKLEATARPEIKFNFGESGAFDLVGSTSGTLIKPQQLAEGVGRNSRIGDKVKTRNIKMQAIFRMKPGSSNATSAVRILVLRSKKSSPTTADMPTWYGAVDEDKFFVIKDTLTNITVPAAITGAYVGSTVKKFNINVPTKLRKLQYNGGSVQSPQNNEYIIYFLAETLDVEVGYNWKHYYLDN